MKKKTTVICAKNKTAFCALLVELKGWQIKPALYATDENALTVTTRSNDVIDVATETFLRSPELVTFVEKNGS